MSETVHQIVSRLRTISAQDRDWLLRRLSEDERRQVLNALVGEGAVPTLREVSVNGASGNRAAKPTDKSGASELSILERATTHDVVDLLAGEADWTIVVLLKTREWPWAEEYLRSLPGHRLRSLRELADQLGNEIRPKVKETVTRIIAGRLRRNGRDHSERSIFDVALERAQRSAQIPQGVAG